MATFRQSHNPSLEQGTCGAFNRAEMATCEGFEDGGEGWCKWTLMPTETRKVIGGTAAKPKFTVIQSVSGECFL